MTATKNKSTTRLNFDALESRDVMSVSSVYTSGGIMTVYANNLDTSVVVENAGSGYVRLRDVGTGASWVRSGISRVDFVGGSGHDRFVNNVSTLATRAWGNAGNDYLEGYNAVDIFVGGAGNDTLVGYGGNDQMWGEGGNDILRGMAGNDYLVGGDGNDTINGGDGADKMWGGYGDDVLIAIDNSTGDTAQGDGGRDALWVDSNYSWFVTYRDSTPGLESIDKLQAVRSFANGADRTLNGDNITDPTAMAGTVYKRFGGPLFSASGPRLGDIDQGGLGDCWLLAGLGAIALDSPTAIRQNVVDFGDGTYGVRLGNNFYRVDGDLPATSSTSTNPAYAGLGAEGSLWAAIVEKAYAHYRTGANSYASLEGGWSVEVNQAFGASSTTNNTISSYSSATALGNAMYNAWLGYNAVTIGFTSIPSGNVGLIDDHMYTVVSFTRNAAGNVTHVTLRNPWGWDGVNFDSNSNDALVTISVNTLYQCVGRVNWGRV
ncbi:MAG TPA: C2 family cysteine protease [Gemmata sp.]|nr:C2 family cysteine protease [Gemmata sp.]